MPHNFDQQPDDINWLTEPPTADQQAVLSNLHQQHLEGGYAYTRWARHLAGHTGLMVVVTREVNFQVQPGGGLSPPVEAGDYELTLGDYLMEDHNGTEIDITMPLRQKVNLMPRLRLLIADSGELFVAEPAVDGVMTSTAANHLLETRPAGLRVGGLIHQLITELVGEGEADKYPNDALDGLASRRIVALARAIQHARLEYAEHDDEMFPREHAQAAVIKAASFIADDNPEHARINSRYRDLARRTVVIFREHLFPDPGEHDREIVVKTAYGKRKRPEHTIKSLKFSHDGELKPKVDIANRRHKGKITRVPTRLANSTDYQGVIDAIVDSSLEPANSEDQ